MKRNKQVAQDGTVATPDYAAIAVVMQQALDTISSLIPSSPLKDGAPIAYLRRRLGVSPTMIARAITASEGSPRFQGLMDVPEARDTLVLVDAFRPVFQRMSGITQDLRLAIEARLVKTGGEALGIYAAAKRIAQTPDGGGVIAYLESMEEAMPKGKGRRRKKVTSDSTEPPE